MTKMKVLAMALALLAVVPAAFAQTNACNGGVSIQAVIVGSSAQFNLTAFAAQSVITTGGGTFNLFSVKGKDTSGTPTAQIIDSRVTTGLFPNPSDSATLWVAWDGGVTCKVWAYFSTDSEVGVKDFFAYGKAGSPSKSVAFAYGQLDTAMSTNPTTWCGSSCSQGKVFGLSDTTLYVTGQDVLPSPIIVALNIKPASIPPGNPPTYCGGGTTATDYYCYFNAAATDIRPEDALYAVTRALSNYDTKELNGLGYNSTNCGGDGLAVSKVGCPIYTAQATGSKFFASTFKLSGTDPIASGTVPAYTTIPIGASPIVVFVNNADTSATGFGATSSGNYVFTNIDRNTLSHVFTGQLSRTTDLLTTAANTTALAGGQPIQVVQREPLSGTYNTFEFTGVRTISGGLSSAAVFTNNTNITSNAWSGQELGVDPTGVVDPAQKNFQNDATDCPSASGSAPTGLVPCSDPLYLPTASGGVRMRAIGTGEEVPAVNGQNPGQPAVPDGIGYAFWSYGNMKPVKNGLVHYLTVDGVDPLFAAPGTNGSASAYQFPACTSVPCSTPIPFTHVADGSYPLWSLLRAVTFSGTHTPPAVASFFASEINQANTAQVYDFVPILNASGNLNLFVFRSHFKQTNSPLNGHKTCTSFSPPTPASCLVDAGGDMGGSIETVQADVDFFTDFGSEIIGQRQ